MATAILSELRDQVSGDDQDGMGANYRQNYDRLVHVQRKYDPDNLFHLNQNIRP